MALSSQWAVAAPQRVIAVEEAISNRRPRNLASTSFFSMEQVNDVFEVLIDFHYMRDYGIMQASRLGEKGPTVAETGFKQRNYRVGTFKERILHDVEDLFGRRRLGTLDQTRTIEDIIDEDIEHLLIRQTNLIEQQAVDAMLGGYTVDYPNGMSYTVSFPLPGNLNANSTFNYVTDPSNADPITDWFNMAGQLSKSGADFSEVWMTWESYRLVAQTGQFKILTQLVPHNWSTQQVPEDFAQVDLINAIMRTQMMTPASGPAPTARLYNDSYRLDTGLVTQLTAGTNSVIVDDPHKLASGQQVTLEAFDSENLETLTINTVNLVTKLVTFTGNAVKTYRPQSRLRYQRTFLPDFILMFTPRTLPGASRPAVPIGRRIEGPVDFEPAGNIDRPGAGHGLEVFIRRDMNPKEIETVSVYSVITAVTRMGSIGRLNINA